MKKGDSERLSSYPKLYNRKVTDPGFFLKSIMFLIK